MDRADLFETLFEMTAVMPSEALAPPSFPDAQLRIEGDAKHEPGIHSIHQ
ncbi:hypothetical protein [Bradyrhizobium mercantei]|nr:hypothetical protein [Bradyrhizobium mercantei]